MLSTHAAIISCNQARPASAVDMFSMLRPAHARIQERPEAAHHILSRRVARLSGDPEAASTVSVMKHPPKALNTLLRMEQGSACSPCTRAHAGAGAWDRDLQKTSVLKAAEVPEPGQTKKGVYVRQRVLTPSPQISRLQGGSPPRHRSR